MSSDRPLTCLIIPQYFHFLHEKRGIVLANVKLKLTLGQTMKTQTLLKVRV